MSLGSSGAFGVLRGALEGAFGIQNDSKMLTNRDPKTVFSREAFSEAFFKHSVRFLGISGPSEPVKS